MVDCPDGYLPMTVANGLGNMVDYTNRAANDVAAQNGQVTPLTALPPAGPVVSANTSTPSGAAAPSAGTIPPAAQVASNDSSSGARTPTNSPSSSSVAPKPSPSESPVAELRPKTPGLSSTLSGVFLPVILGLAVLGSLVSAGALVRPRPRRRR